MRWTGPWSGARRIDRFDSCRRDHHFPIISTNYSAISGRLGHKWEVDALLETLVIEVFLHLDESRRSLFWGHALPMFGVGFNTLR